MNASHIHQYWSLYLSCLRLYVFNKTTSVIRLINLSMDRKIYPVHWNKTSFFKVMENKACFQWTTYTPTAFRAGSILGRYWSTSAQHRANTKCLMGQAQDLFFKMAALWDTGNKLSLARGYMLSRQISKDVNFPQVYNLRAAVKLGRWVLICKCYVPSNQWNALYEKIERYKTAARSYILHWSGLYFGQIDGPMPPHGLFKSRNCKSRCFWIIYEENKWHKI